MLYHENELIGTIGLVSKKRLSIATEKIVAIGFDISCGIEPAALACCFKVYILSAGVIDG